MCVKIQRLINTSIDVLNWDSQVIYVFGYKTMLQFNVCLPAMQFKVNKLKISSFFTFQTAQNNKIEAYDFYLKVFTVYRFLWTEHSGF